MILNGSGSFNPSRCEFTQGECMPCQNCKSVDHLRDDFETAKQGLSAELVHEVMRGSFIPKGDPHDAAARKLLRAWVAYKPHYRMPALVN